MKLLRTLLAAGLTLAASAWASEPSLLRVLKRQDPSPSHTHGTREAYRVRLNGVPLDLARFWSPKPPAALEKEEERTFLTHADGNGGWVVWKGRAERFPIGPAARGEDPGGISFPNARRLLSAISDRPDRLSAAFYEAGAGSASALDAGLRAEGWEEIGGNLLARGPERLALSDGRPGTWLVYWRLTP